MSGVDPFINWTGRSVAGLAAVTAVMAFIVALASCEPEQARTAPTVVDRCVADMTVPVLEPNYGGGVPMGSGMQMVFRSRCVKWEKVCVANRRRVDLRECLR